MSKRLRVVLIGVALLMCSIAAKVQAEPLVVYTTSNRLLTFDSATPGTISSNVAIVGLQTNESLRGIDYRPANGLLYGLSNENRIYIVNPLTGSAVLVSTLSVALSNPGGFFGVDFNPTVDRLRVVGSDDQNLRVNVDTGAAIVDLTINPAINSVVGSAYSNNFAGATATTLYAIDPGADALYTQNPPNVGTLNLVGILGVNTESFVGFDISGATGVAFSVLSAPGSNFGSLYTINLATGAATLVGQIGTGFVIDGLAAQPGAAVPEPGTMFLLAAGLAGVATRVRRRRNTK